ncbi:MAG: hypothetical protein D6795_11940 [Deltaproteobacteria bacterium]|nr:MAG: hypothetical protein D6795_11940 [Deltaproteobacteria bacterium]
MAPNIAKRSIRSRIAPIVLLLVIAGCGYEGKTAFVPLPPPTGTEAVVVSSRGLGVAESIRMLGEITTLSREVTQRVRISGDVQLFRTLYALNDAEAPAGIASVLWHEIDDETETEQLVVETRFPFSDARLVATETMTIATAGTPERSDDRLIDYLGFVRYRDGSQETIEALDLDVENGEEAEIDLFHGRVRRTSLRVFPESARLVSEWESADLLLFEPEGENEIIRYERRRTTAGGLVRTLRVEPEVPHLQGEEMSGGEIEREDFFPAGEYPIRSIFRRISITGAEEGSLLRQILYTNNTENRLEVTFEGPGRWRFEERRADGARTSGFLADQRLDTEIAYPPGHEPVRLAYRGALTPEGGEVTETIVFSTGEARSRTLAFTQEAVFGGTTLRVAVHGDANDPLGWFTLDRNLGRMKGCFLRFEIPGEATVTPEGFFHRGKHLGCFPPVNRGLVAPGVLAQISIRYTRDLENRLHERVTFTPYHLPEVDEQRLDVTIEPDGRGSGTLQGGKEHYRVLVRPDRSGRLIDERGAVSFFVY